jgi:CheY-like chemotaxis protein
MALHGRKEDMNKEQRRKAVLVVDDDPKSLKLVATRLTQEGYRVITAPSGKDALTMIKLWKIGT